MFDAVHEMRTRVISSPAFTGEKILGAILFEDTMDREIDGIPTGQYLWGVKGIVPFIKVDKGLQEEKNGVQLMKPIPDLGDLLEKSREKNMFGTKMRSVIKQANEAGIKEIVEQQFEFALHILAGGLVPILEPEVDINSPDKEKIEDILKAEILKGLNALPKSVKVMLKLTIPTKVNHYKECIEHPNCLRVVALSGGYSRDEANKLLSKQTGMIASFSRALLEDLSFNQAPDEFDKVLAKTVDSVFEASKAG